MERLELHPPSRGVLTQPAGRFLLILMAALVVVAVSSWFVRPLVTSWTRPVTPQATEAWPTVPATYVPRQIAAPAVARPIPTSTPLPQPVWRELNNLTTIEFTTASVVEANRKTDVPLLGEMTTDRLLLRVVGKVQVGIDLSQVKNVQIDGKSIRLAVPKPAVTSVELLPDESKIFEHEQVLFLSQYAGLEKEALETARLQLHQEVADNASMMKLAEEFARLHLTEFLSKAGFEKVTIDFQPVSVDESPDFD